MTNNSTIQAQHTPAPWYIQTRAPYLEITFKDEPFGHALADLHYGCPEITGITKEIALANAKLMAAAPDLLEALEGLLGSYQNQVDTDKPGNARHIDRAVSAINKSRGGV